MVYPRKHGARQVPKMFAQFRRWFMRIRISSTTRGAKMEVKIAPHMEGSRYQAFLGREPAPEAGAERARGFTLASSGLASRVSLFFCSPNKDAPRSFRGPGGEGSGARPALSNSAKPMVGPRRDVARDAGLGPLAAGTAGLAETDSARPTGPA